MPNPLDAERESALLRTAQKDLSAFQEIYSYYLPRVYAYVSYRIGSVQDSEDLTAGIFLKAIERLKAFHWQGEGSFRAWLFRIAHDRMIDFFRSRLHEPQSVPVESLPELVNSTLLPTDHLLQKEKYAYLRQLIAFLPERQQEVITLKFFGGLRNIEIAQVLELDERTIAAHLCRGLDKLHQHYLETFFHQEGKVSHD